MVATRRLNGSKVNRIQASALRPVFSKLARGDYPDNGCFAPNPNVLLCDRECPLHVEPGQTDWVLTLKRADIDENTYVLNKRAKSRPQLAAVSEQGGAYSPVAFLCAHAAGRHPPLVPDHAQLARKGANVAQKARVEPRASNRVVGAVRFPQTGMFYVRIGTRKKFRQLVYIRKKQSIFLTSLVLRHILKACSNVAEASASRCTKMLIDRRKVVVANGNSRPTRAFRFCGIWDTV